MAAVAAAVGVVNYGVLDSEDRSVFVWASLGRRQATASSVSVCGEEEEEEEEDDRTSESHE